MSHNSSHICHLVTIIVPIYNVEKYVRECILGVITQSFVDWELLLIDDGSTDQSGNICDEYSERDARIKVIHKSNTGVSDTRNKGLDIASGKYVIFLDADDYWYDCTALETLVSIAEKYNLDVVRGDYKAIRHNGVDLFERPFSITKKNLSGRILNSSEFYEQILGGENFLWLALIRRSSIGQLRLNVNRSFLEDMEFYAYLFLSPLRCMFVPVRFYAYRKHDLSASNAARIRNIMDSFSMCDVFYECSNKLTSCTLRDIYRRNSIMMYYWTLETVSLTKNRNRIIRDLALKNKQKQVAIWARNDVARYPIIVFLNPKIGVLVFRFCNFIKAQLHIIMNRVKW